MNDAASNALLKTLEEPPTTSHIILIASRADSLLPTILSRCQTIRFGPVSVQEIEKYLLGTERFSPEDAALAARVCGGSIGRALELVPASFRTQRSLMLGVLRSAAAGNMGDLLSASEEMSDARNKEDFEENVTILQDLIRDTWLIRNGGSDSQLLNIDLKPELTDMAAKFSPRILATWLEDIEAIQEAYLVNINRKVATDSVFIKVASA
jgi:DNA polymerase-3 subunit delta'